jgi:hypothetical protein
MSQVILTKGDAASGGLPLRIELYTSGTYAEPELAGAAGAYLIEHAVSQELASGEIDIQMVGDRYPEAPAESATPSYNGDAYLVGRVAPGTGSGVPRTEFTGFFDGLANCQRLGFDETAADLWHPLFDGKPRFCLGRAMGDTTGFSSRQAFYDTLSDLKPIGILSKTSLKEVGFAAGLSCP